MDRLSGPSQVSFHDKVEGARITGIEAIPIAAPEYPSGGWLIIRVHTAAGAEGFGECWVPDRNGHGVLAVKAFVDETLAAGAIGEAVLEPTRLWDKLYRRAALVYDRRGLAVRALSGIDIACHDAAGKLLGVPAYQLLGGRVDNRIQVYVSCIHVDPADWERVLEDTTYYVGHGFTALKYYGWPGIGVDEARDIEMLRRIRSAAGTNVQLMLDLGRPRNFAEAIRLARMFERAEVGIAWWEEPFSSTDDQHLLTRLASRISIPLAAGESEITAFAQRDLIVSGAVSIIQPDLTMTGGLTEGRRICELARLFKIPVAPHNWGTIINFAASLHLLAATPGAYMCEYPITSRAARHRNDRQPSPMMTDLAQHEIKIEGSTAVLPDAPGLGLEIDPVALQRYALQ